MGWLNPRRTHIERRKSFYTNSMIIHHISWLSRPLTRSRIYPFRLHVHRRSYRTNPISDPTFTRTSTDFMSTTTNTVYITSSVSNDRETLALSLVLSKPSPFSRSNPRVLFRYLNHHGQATIKPLANDKATPINIKNSTSRPIVKLQAQDNARHT